MINNDTVKFSHLINVQEADIDELGHVNNVIYLRWVQDVATAHWNFVAPDTIKETFIWVVIRHEIDYFNPALPGDEIIGYTWVGTHQGAKFDRYVRLCRTETQKVLAEAKTTWCLLDAKTMRPRRIEDNILRIL